MEPRCKVCRHPKRDKIEEQVERGVTYRDIAARFHSLSPSAIHRHKALHMGEEYLIAAELSKEEDKERARLVREETREIITQVESASSVNDIAELERAKQRLAMIGEKQESKGKLREASETEERVVRTVGRKIDAKIKLLELQTQIEKAAADRQQVEVLVVIHDPAIDGEIEE